MNKQISNGMSVLITSASRKVSLIQAFKKALRKEGGGKVMAADINPLSVAFMYADVSFITPRYKDPAFFPTLFRLCKKNNIGLIVPTSDDELSLFAEKKEEFRRRGIAVMVASSDTIAVCSDKLQFAFFCKEEGFLTPKIYEQPYRKIRQYPLFINDRFGKGAKYAFKVNTKQELVSFLERITHPIIQEYINEKEYTIDLFSDFEGNVISVVPRERIAVFGGESFIGKTYKNKILINAALRLAGALQLVGHNTIQCFFDGKRVLFIEVNPRYGGGANLSFAAGADTPLYAIRIAQGKKVKSHIGKFKDGLYMLRHTQDIFVTKKEIRWKKA